MKKRFTDGLRWVCKAGIIASDCLENDGLGLWDWHWYFDCDWDWISGEWFPGWHLAFKVPNFFGEHGVSSGWRADLFAKPPARHLHLHRSSNTHFNSSCARARQICLEFFSPFCSNSRRSSFTWWHLLHSSDSSKYLQIYVDPGNWDGAAALATTVVEWHLMSGDWSSSYCHFHRCSAAWCGAVQCGAVWLCATVTAVARMSDENQRDWDGQGTRDDCRPENPRPETIQLELCTMAMQLAWQQQ